MFCYLLLYLLIYMFTDTIFPKVGYLNYLEGICFSQGKERACLFEYLGIIYIYYVMGLSVECLCAIQLLYCYSDYSYADFFFFADMLTSNHPELQLMFVLKKIK